MNKFTSNLIAAGMLFAFGFSPSSMAAGTYTVTVLNDTHAVSPSTSPNDSGGHISVRSAIEAANAQASPTIINISPGTYNLTFGELDIATNAGKNIILQSSGGMAANTIINQTNTTDRVFNIDLNSVGHTVVTLIGLTIQGGHDKTDIAGGAGILAGSIAATPKDVLNLNGCIIANNHCSTPNTTYTAQIGGGVQMAGGDLNITNCTFTNNTAGSSSGGAIAFFTQSVASSLTITNSTFANNGLTNTSGSGPIGGGAIFIGSTAASVHAIKSSTFANNFALGSSGNTFGGAIDLNTGTLNITNTAFTTNSASGNGGQAGAIYADAGTNNIGYARFRGNTATTGGTVLNHPSNGAVTSAENNWWATNGAPGVMISGFNVNAWLKLNPYALPSQLLAATSTTMFGGLTTNSAGTALVPANLVGLIGLPLTFNNAANGTLSAANTFLPGFGFAQATFTAGNTAGFGTATITFDGVVVTNSISIGVNSASVANTNDNGAGSLRQAIADVFSGGTITFNPGLAGSTITLTNGELLLARNVTITGPGANQLVISGNQNGRVFDIQSGATNVISGLTIANGMAMPTAPNPNLGGGIYNGGDLTLFSCTIRGNSGTNNSSIAGGIYSTNVLRLIACTVGPTNTAAGVAGGIYVAPYGTLQMLDCTVISNSAPRIGGVAVDIGGNSMLTNCTITGNFDTGIGIDALCGGYVSVSATLFKNTIIAGNASAAGSAVADVAIYTANIPVVSLGHNLIGITNATTGWLATDLVGNTTAPLNARLGPLANNGGPTLTCALLVAPNSPAINAGDNSGATPFDQRGTGFARIVSSTIDIGAFELIPPILNIAYRPNQTVTSWPTNAVGYVLESTTNLTTSWNVVSGTKVLVGNQYFVTNNVSGSKLFFRLNAH